MQMTHELQMRAMGSIFIVETWNSNTKTIIDKN